MAHSADAPAALAANSQVSVESVVQLAIEVAQQPLIRQMIVLVSHVKPSLPCNSLDSVFTARRNASATVVTPIPSTSAISR